MNYFLMNWLNISPARSITTLTSKYVASWHIFLKKNWFLCKQFPFVTIRQISCLSQEDILLKKYHNIYTRIGPEWDRCFRHRLNAGPVRVYLQCCPVDTMVLFLYDNLFRHVWYLFTSYKFISIITNLEFVIVFLPSDSAEWSHHRKAFGVKYR